MRRAARTNPCRDRQWFGLPLILVLGSGPEGVKGFGMKAATTMTSGKKDTTRCSIVWRPLARSASLGGPPGLGATVSSQLDSKF
jgi:hypothetical protein